MDNDKLAWFGGGVVIGLLIGLGVALGFCHQKVQEVHADADRAREETLKQRKIWITNKMRIYRSSKKSSNETPDIFGRRYRNLALEQALRDLANQLMKETKNPESEKKDR